MFIIYSLLLTVYASRSGIGFVGLKTSPRIVELAYIPDSSCQVFAP